MLHKICAYVQAYKNNDDGATAIEYGLIAAGISLAIVAVVYTFGDQLEQTFNSMEAAMTTANTSVAGGSGGGTP